MIAFMTLLILQSPDNDLARTIDKIDILVTKRATKYGCSNFLKLFL